MSPRQDLEKIYQKAIDAADPEKAVHACLCLENNTLKLGGDNEPPKAFDLSRFKKIVVVGCGKATASMARAVEDILGARIHAGCICVKYGYTRRLSFIETIEAAHPLPDENSMAGAKQIKAILENASADDLVISLISGGGSALLSLPVDGISLEEKQKTTDLLIKSGAPIHEINRVRSRLSLVKGGNLARAAYPATVLNLMVSDVVGDRIDVIASGPFVSDTGTFTRALEVLGKYNLIRRVPPSVLACIAEKANDEADKENKADKSPDHDITHCIVASNIICLKAAKTRAKQLGYHSLILSSTIEGETKAVANWHSQIAKEVVSSSNPLAAPACIISGGETTVKVKGGGKGGRNMEFAMQAAPLIEGYDTLVMASIGTDGTDGPTDAAGAMAHGSTMKMAARAGLEIKDYMNNNDSYHFFEALGDLIVTGPTHTNVMDIRIILVQTP